MTQTHPDFVIQSGTTHARAALLWSDDLQHWRPIHGLYARSWRALLTMDPCEPVNVPGWIVGLPRWGMQPSTAGEVLRHVRRALEHRINWRGGYTPPTARDDRELIQDASRERARRKRIIVRQWNSPRVRARLGHLLHVDD